jgi:hypothetical protein
MSTWFKFPCNYWSDPRQLRLRREIGDAALWLPARLWTFAATSAESGKLAEYSPSDLARLLEYAGDGEAMIVALQAAGYLDKKCRIFGWAELFSLPASRRLAGKTGAAGRWAKKASPVNGRQKEEKEKIEEREAHALRDGMRDASNPTRTPSFDLPEQEKSRVAKEFNISPEGIIEAIRCFTEIKANYPQDPQTPEAFCGWLRTSPHGKGFLRRFQQTQRKPAIEPGWKQEPNFDWRTWLKKERPPDAYPSREIWEEGLWIAVVDTWKKEIWKKGGAPTYAPEESIPR